MYATLSADAKGQLSQIAHQWGLGMTVGTGLFHANHVDGTGTINGGDVFGLPDGADIADPATRWRYGMSLGAAFAPGGTGYDGTQAMPAVGPDYQMNAQGSNTAFDQANDRSHLHTLDAYLNHNRHGERTGPSGAERDHASQYLTDIIASLTPFEKGLVLADRMPDGSRYSTAFGELGAARFPWPLGIQYGATDAQVTAALPADGDPAAIDAFISHFHTVRDQNTVDAVPPTGPGMSPFGGF
jgi:hypothetical protein